MYHIHKNLQCGCGALNLNWYCLNFPQHCFLLNPKILYTFLQIIPKYPSHSWLMCYILSYMAKCSKKDLLNGKKTICQGYIVGFFLSFWGVSKQNIDLLSGGTWHKYIYQINILLLACLHVASCQLDLLSFLFIGYVHWVSFPSISNPYYRIGSECYWPNWWQR